MQKIEEKIVCIGLAFLITLVFLAAVFRFFDFDMSWSTDTAQLVFAWICLIGADLAMRKKTHRGMELVVERLPNKVRQNILLVSNMLIILFLILLVIYGTNLCIVNYSRKFNTLKISYSFATASVPTGALLMLYTMLKDTVNLVKKIVRKESVFTENEKDVCVL